MEADRLEHFRGILLEQLRQQTQNILEEQSVAQSFSADDVKDSVDLSLRDVNTEIAFRLGEHKSQMVTEIEQALLRMKEGTYGECAACGLPINERRLDAVPTARYDAACQTLIEAEGEGELEMDMSSAV
jgi:DnaK suppressor protein